RRRMPQSEVIRIPNRRRFRPAIFGLVWAASALTLPSPVSAHDGVLPASQAVLEHEGRVLVPARYFGAFVGSPNGGAWRWICGEAINRNPARGWAMAGSGALHVTDFAGLTTSRDGGCSWSAAIGEIATRSTSRVVADPVEPARAWATTNAG